MDPVSFGRLASVDALPLLPKAGRKALVGHGWLLLPGLHRESAVCVPGQERLWTEAFRALQDPASTQRRSVSTQAKPFPDRPRGMHRKRYLRMKARALELEQDLPAKLRRKPVDYQNLVYYVS